jgi:Uma2 family endonuclease
MESTRRLFTVTDYYRMADAGVIGPDERVELLEGEIIRMNPIGPPHANCVDRLMYLFVTRLGERVSVRIQNPVRLDELSEPEPDVVLVRKDRDLQVHPGPSDVILLVEVADTSVGFDRQVKLPIYARAGIAEVWIVDLPGQALEVYRGPQATGYSASSRLVGGDSIAAADCPDVQFPVGEILGP